MSQFFLSPGITPEIVGLFAVEFPVAIGIGYLWGGRRGVELAFALNAFLLGGFKFYTDWADLTDDLVAGAALLGGIGIALRSTAPRWTARSPAALWVVIGAAILVVGALKIKSDFYDPWDIFLADVCVVAGLWFIALRRTAAGLRPPTGTGGPDPPT